MLAALLALTMTASALDPASLWPSPFPPVGRESAREPLTAAVRRKRRALGLNNLAGLDGETVSKAFVLLPKARENAGLIAFEIESGPQKGVHACEALGRGKTSRAPKPGWIAGVVREPGGRSTPIHYAPIEAESGATLPGIYELRNIHPREYAIRFLNKSTAGEEELVRRTTADGERPYFSGVFKSWYPRDPRHAGVMPVDMVWSERYQKLSQGAAFPFREKTEGAKDPDQLRYNPRYYWGPFGRNGFAIHTDRWDDPQTATDPELAARDEFRSFLYRDTEGCLKVRADCLRLINAFVDEQRARGRRVLLDVREL